MKWASPQVLGFFPNKTSSVIPVDLLRMTMMMMIIINNLNTNTNNCTNNSSNLLIGQRQPVVDDDVDQWIDKIPTNIDRT